MTWLPLHSLVLLKSFDFLLTFPLTEEERWRYRGSKRETSRDDTLPCALTTWLCTVYTNKPSQTHSTPAGCHGHNRRPLVGSRVVSLSTTELCCIISASHSIYHVLVYRTAQVLPPRPHGRNCVPAVLLGIVAFHCRGNDTSLDNRVGRQWGLAHLSLHPKYCSICKDATISTH